MIWNEKITGALKYSPSIKDEVILESSTSAFMNLCRTENGREMAAGIINNYIENGEQNSSERIS